MKSIVLRSPAIVAFFVVFATGSAINVENSGNPIDTPKEAVERVVDDVVEGYTQGISTSFSVND